MRRCLPAVFAIGWCASVAPAQFVGQQTLTRLSFDDLSFTNTTFATTQRVSWVPRFGGDTIPVIWFFSDWRPLVSRSAAPIDNCTIQNFSATPGSLQASYEVHAVLPAVTVHEFRFVSRPDAQRVALGDQGGLAALFFNSFSSPISGLPSTSAVYTVAIPGDWTHQGTGPGQLEMLGMSPDWAVEQPWTFAAGETSLRVVRLAGDGGAGLRFTLHGAAIPAGPSACALLLGFVLAGPGFRAHRR